MIPLRTMGIDRDIDYECLHSFISASALDTRSFLAVRTRLMSSNLVIVTHAMCCKTGEAVVLGCCSLLSSEMALRCSNKLLLESYQGLLLSLNWSWPRVP